MKVIVDFKRDLHPVSQLILFLLYKGDYEKLKRYFAVVLPLYLESLQKAGYVLTKGPYELKYLDAVNVSIPKARALFGEINSSEDWIDEYRSLFAGKKIGGMGTRTACIQKMNKFLETYSFTRKTILMATQRYISSCKKDSYAYMQRADYFIFKDETVDNSRVTTSNLATLCEEVEAIGNDEIKETGWQKDAI